MKMRRRKKKRNSNIRFNLIPKKEKKINKSKISQPLIIICSKNEWKIYKYNNNNYNKKKT